MAEKTVALFGVGTLGAVAALEFARAQTGTLRLVDGDYVDTGNSVRWPLGLRDAGRRKVDAVAEFIATNHPFTSVEGYHRTLGNAPENGRLPDSSLLDNVLADADLVFDATAHHGLQLLLAEWSRERALPYISVDGRQGGWGGVVFRQRPGRGRGCWHCLQLALQAGGSVADAPGAAAAVQPRACGDVTFSGASFDMSTLALDAVRRAVALLCAPAGGYPDDDWDVAVIRLRNDDGSACPPTWTLYELPPDPTCGCSSGTP